ncbi:MAG: hypothetical protein ABIQ73_17295 [Acidimicrobiales bacterium]
MTGCPEHPPRVRATVGALVAGLLAALVLGATGLYAPVTAAAFAADVEIAEEFPPVAVDIQRDRRLAAPRIRRRATTWRSRRIVRSARPALEATRRGLPRFHRRGSPPRRGPPIVE